MTEPKTKSVGVVKIEKLAKVGAFKDYDKATKEAMAARKMQSEAKSKLKDYLATKLSVEEKEALDFVLEGQNIRVFINLVQPKRKTATTSLPDLSDKF